MGIVYRLNDLLFLFTFICSSSTKIEAVVERSWQKIGATIRGASESPTLWPTSKGAEKCVTKLLVHKTVGDWITATRQISQKLGQRYLSWTHLLVETSGIKGIPATKSSKKKSDGVLDCYILDQN